MTTPPPAGPWPGYGAPRYGPPVRAIPRTIGRGAGAVPLRPLALGDVLDGMFRLLSATARPTFLITAIFVVPIQLLAAFLQRDTFSIGLGNLITNPEVAEQALETQSLMGANVALFLTAAASGFVLPIVAGAICQLVGAAYLGQSITWRDALRVAGRKSGALIGSWWLHILAYAAAAVPAIALLVGGFSNAVLGLLGLLLTFVVFIGFAFLIPLFTPTAPAIVTEGLGPWSGLVRSVRLVRRRYWPTLGTVLLTSLIVQTIAGILSGIPSTIALFTGGSYAWLLGAVGGTIGSMLTVPLVAIVATLVYYDLRIRNEGFDLQLLASQLGLRAPEPGAAVPAWPGPGGAVPAWPGPGGAVQAWPGPGGAPAWPPPAVPSPPPTPAPLAPPGPWGRDDGGWSDTARRDGPG